MAGWLPTQDIYLILKLHGRWKSNASGKQNEITWILMKQWPLWEYAWMNSPAEFQGQRVKDNQTANSSPGSPLE